VTGGVAASRSGALAAAASHLPWASPAAACPSTQLTVLTAPEVTGTVQTVLQPLGGHPLPDGSCLQVVVQGQDPATTVANAGTTAIGGLPRVWIPDASLWVGQAPSWDARPVGSLASSPVVLAATPATVKRLGWAGRAVSWPQALTTNRILLAPRITDDASALLGLLALARSLGRGPQTEQAIAGVILAASRQNATDEPSAFAATLTSTAQAPTPVMLTNRQALKRADGDPATRGLVAVRPQGLPAALDYPILRIARPDDDIVSTAATDLVVAALTSAKARAVATADGFGPPAATTVPTTAAGLAAMKAVNDQVSAFVGQVRTRATPSRLLTLIDVSLSMRAPVRPGYSRAQLAVQAAAGAGLLLPDTSAIGLWSFAGREADGKPYKEIAPIDLMSAADHGTTHRQVVGNALANLPRHLADGGTALYNATLAAIQKARGSYDQNATNAVVVFTDGANDYRGGITLAQFVAAARSDRAAHPGHELTLVLIGIGPDADMKALGVMAKAVNGLVYHADNVQALNTVVFDAIAKRTRPQR
jgi:Ca-activated chloride channel family protein